MSFRLGRLVVFAFLLALASVATSGLNLPTGDWTDLPAGDWADRSTLSESSPIR